LPRNTPFAAGLLLITILIADLLHATHAPSAAPAVPASNAPHAGTGPTACSLLTKEDAAEALGEPVRGPDRTEMGEVSSCEYSGSAINRVHLNLMRLPKDQAQMYAALCAEKGKQGLTGLGDVTCWYNEQHEELQVLKGTQFFSVELRRNGDPTEAIKRVAKRVYDKLP
jgi:hypothetical protein